MADQTQWWAHPDLGRCWVAIASRLEREGLIARGGTRLGGLSRAEQRAVSDLLGRTVLRERVVLDLAALEARLRTRAGIGLVDAAETVLGRALLDRPAHRAATEARREEPVAAYRQWRAEHPQACWPGLDDWLDGLRRDGVLGRAPDPASLVTTALGLLWARRDYLDLGWAGLPGGGELQEPVARTELAAGVFGDAHALDDDRRLGIVVLRAVEALAAQGVFGRTGAPGAATGPPRMPRNPAGGPEPTRWFGQLNGDYGEGARESAMSRRMLWEQIGVLADRVSSTAITLGVRFHRTSAPGRRLAAYADAWTVAHVTWRDLDAGLAVEAGQRILVCENPRVLEAAADLAAGGLTSTAGDVDASAIGFVCASGRPTLVVIALLDRLRAAGAQLLYHGDFDWAGLEIAGMLVRRCGVIPWRMSSDDYLAAPAQLPLTGRPVDAAWDPTLARAMERRGLAVHEEALLPGLLAHL